MKKIKTVFAKDENNNMTTTIPEDNLWVLDNGIATIKFDGTSVKIAGILYKRYDAKKDKKTGLYKAVPEGAIPCQEPDEVTGHWPHWVPCDRNDPSDKYHFEAFDKQDEWEDGTYELCGPKINGNPQCMNEHLLIEHGKRLYNLPNGHFLRDPKVDYDSLKSFLETHNIEGIVYHEKNGDRMLKIRRKDFGIEWPLKWGIGGYVITREPSDYGNSSNGGDYEEGYYTVFFKGREVGRLFHTSCDMGNYCEINGSFVSNTVVVSIDGIYISVDQDIAWKYFDVDDDYVLTDDEFLDMLK